MPEWTALGVKSSSSVASVPGRSCPPVEPQPAAATARSAASGARSGRTEADEASCLDSRTDAPPGHVLAQRHALPLADLRVPLQVLRVRDTPRAPARAGGGRAADRRRRAARRQGAAG